MRSLTKSSGGAKRTARIPRVISPSRPTDDVHRLGVCPGLMDLMDNAGALPTTPQAQQQPEWLFHLFARPATSVWCRRARFRSVAPLGLGLYP